MDQEHQIAGEPMSLGIRGRCPRCGKGHIFDGYLALRPNCEVCGLDYSFADPADGPAFFAMSIWAFPALGFALWVELKFEPPIWVHVITTLPMLVLGCMALLRPLKGWLVCSQYVHKAEQGRLDYDEKPAAPAEDVRPGA